MPTKEQQPFQIEMFDVFIVVVCQKFCVWLCWRKDCFWAVKLNKGQTLWLSHIPDVSYTQHLQSSCAGPVWWWWEGRQHGWLLIELSVHICESKNGTCNKQRTWTHTEVWLLSQLSICCIREKSSRAVGVSVHGFTLIRHYSNHNVQLISIDAAAQLSDSCVSSEIT